MVTVERTLVRSASADQLDELHDVLPPHKVLGDEQVDLIVILQVQPDTRDWGVSKFDGQGGCVVATVEEVCDNIGPLIVWVGVVGHGVGIPSHISCHLNPARHSWALIGHPHRTHNANGSSAPSMASTLAVSSLVLGVRRGWRMVSSRWCLRLCARSPSSPSTRRNAFPQ